MENTITKTLGNGEEITIPNPDLYNNEGEFHKVRKCNNAKRKLKRNNKRNKK